MKNILLLLFMLTSRGVIAQQSPAVKIIFSYYNGGNSWGVPGVYSRGENIEITAVNSTTYKITKHYKVVKYVAKDSLTYINDTTYLKTKTYRRIPQSSIHLLFQQLNTNADNFDPAFIRPYLKSPTKKQILAVAHKIDKTYLFEDDDEEDNAKIRKIEKFDKLDSFINLNKPDVNVDFNVVDAWDGFNISYISRKDTIKFQGNFFKVLGQPVSRQPNNKSGAWVKVANLKINIIADGILPPSSDLKKAIELNSLTTDYIEWYLEKVL
ncbi:MAG: hypothetical protein ABJA76_09990 [Mucilaginibacter sp.]